MQPTAPSRGSGASPAPWRMALAVVSRPAGPAVAELVETIRRPAASEPSTTPRTHFDAWFAVTRLHVFGRGGGSSWCCGDSAVERQRVAPLGAAPRP